MPTAPDEHDPAHSASEVAARSAAGAAGTALGLVLGGPGGALLGAAAGPPLATLARLVSDNLTKRLARIGDALETAATTREQTIDEYLDEIAKDPWAEEIMIELLEIIGHSRDNSIEDIVQILLCELPDIDEDDSIPVEIILNTLKGLSRTHISILEMVSAGASTVEDLEQHSGLDAPLLRPIVRTLELNGLIQDRATLEDLSVPVLWHLTELGRILLDIREARPREG